MPNGVLRLSAAAAGVDEDVLHTRDVTIPDSFLLERQFRVRGY
jgi:hypothetical protein